MNNLRFAIRMLRKAPGFTTVAVLTIALGIAVNSISFSFFNTVFGFFLDGRPEPPPGKNPIESFQIVSAGYFETLSIPLRQGRAFTGADRDGTPRILLINESFARKYWPGQDPLGAVLKVNENNWTIVGVVGDVRMFQLNEKPAPQMYFPHRQFSLGELWVAVRAAGDPRALVQPVKQLIQRLDSQQPITKVAVMPRVIAQSGVVAAWQILISFLGFFAALALLLAALGVYGVISYSVSQRTREFGVRMALGARSDDVLKVVFGGALRLACWGLGVGLLLALALSQLLRRKRIAGVSDHCASTAMGGHVAACGRGSAPARHSDEHQRVDDPRSW